MTTVVVTGATGFVGRSLVPLLGERGDTVVALTRADVDRGPGHVVDLVSEAAPRAVIHLATHFLAAHEPADIPALVRSNVELGTVVAEAASRTHARLVTVGTAWQHFGGANYSPVSLYAGTKQALVPILEYYTQMRALDVRTVTLFDTYGPGDTRPKLVPSLLAAARSGRPLDMSDGQQLIDLTYVEDVARGLADVALRDQAPTDSVLRSGEPLTIRTLVDVMSGAIGRRIPVTWGVRESRPREMRSDWVFGDVLRDWAPQVSLEDGLRRTWDALGQAGT